MPNAWNEVVRTERKAELFIYGLLLKCMENFSDVSIELSEDNKIGRVIRSWARNENTEFGNNAIYVIAKDDGGIILGCNYDLWKLRDDIEMMSSDLFGTIDPEKIGDKIIDEDVHIPEIEIDSLLSGIKKKLIPTTKKEVK